MKKALLGTLVTIGLLTTANVSAAEHNKHFGKNKNHLRIYKKLDLSDSQKQQIKAIFKAKRADKNTDRFEERQQFFEKRRQLIQSKTFDSAVAKQLAETMNNQRVERFVASAEAENKAWNILTPEQQQKAQELLQKRAKKMQEKREKRLEKRQNKDDN